MEYFDYGDLQRYMYSPMLEDQVQQIALQLLEGAQFMHDNDFAHRDLKPAVSCAYGLLCDDAEVDIRWLT